MFVEEQLAIEANRCSFCRGRESANSLRGEQTLDDQFFAVDLFLGLVQAVVGRDGFRRNSRVFRDRFGQLAAVPISQPVPQQPAEPEECGNCEGEGQFAALTPPVQNTHSAC